ncbi:hypothetical protein BJX99DRAFT_264121 [Aspergillus californicus]
MPVKAPPSTRINPVRLNTINHLRVRRPNQTERSACTAVMSSMLSCWASSGYAAEGCIALEAQLRQCMDEKKPSTTKQNSINYHMMRMYPKVVGPKKKKGSLS